MPYIVATIDGFGNTGGRLTIPAKDFVIEYDQGQAQDSDITIMGNGSVFNFASPNSLIMDVSMTESKVKLTGGDSNPGLVAQMTDVYNENEYSSAYIDGNLDENDSVTLQLQDDKLVLENQVKGDSSELVVYTDDDKNTEERYVQIITADTPEEKVEIEDVRAYTQPEGVYLVRFDANGGTVTPGNAETGADGKLAGLPPPTAAATMSLLAGTRQRPAARRLPPTLCLMRIPPSTPTGCPFPATLPLTVKLPAPTC